MGKLKKIANKSELKTLSTIIIKKKIVTFRNSSINSKNSVETTRTHIVNQSYMMPSSTFPNISKEEKTQKIHSWCSLASHNTASLSQESSGRLSSCPISTKIISPYFMKYNTKLDYNEQNPTLKHHLE